MKLLSPIRVSVPTWVNAQITWPLPPTTGRPLMVRPQWAASSSTIPTARCSGPSAMMSRSWVAPRPAPMISNRCAKRSTATGSGNGPEVRARGAHRRVGGAVDGGRFAVPLVRLERSLVGEDVGHRLPDLDFLAGTHQLQH